MFFLLLLLMMMLVLVADMFYVGVIVVVVCTTGAAVVHILVYCTTETSWAPYAPCESAIGAPYESKIIYKMSW